MSESELFAAVERDDEAVVRALVDEDPGRLQARNDDGSSLLIVARFRGAKRTIEFLRSRVSALDIHEAAALCDQSWLESHLSRDPASVSVLSPDGWTPLHLAAFFGPPTVIRFLLAKNAQVNVVSKNGMETYPLHSSAARGDQEAVQLLLSAGAEVDAQQAGGWSALHIGAYRGDEGLVDLLLAHGANPALTGVDGQTPGDLAKVAGFDALASRLGTSAAPSPAAGD